VFFLLEQQGFDCVLYQASKVKAQPGRPKTDKLDSVWLAKVTEQGSVAGSFVPPEDIRRLRTHTRYRRRLTQARTAEKQRVEKLLEDAHLKLSSVISDVHGVSGRAMLDAIAGGERSARALAQLARGTMRRKAAALEEALDCTFFTEEHAFVLSMMLAGIDHYTAQIAVLDERIAALCGPWEHQIAQLDGIPGFGVTSAQDLIAEIGVDMSAFPTAGPPRPPTWPPGPAAPRWTTSPASAPAAPNPRKATGTWPPSPARPPWQPEKPPPAKAPATGGWPAAAANPKPRSPSATPSSRSTTRCCPIQAPGIRTSARTTTSASATPAGRSPITSASSAPPASK
jgi:hypothetical protein